MENKRRRGGVTLLELIVTLSLLAVIMAAAGSALYSASQSYAVNKKLQDDEYNARIALLSITREAHRGVSGINIVDTGSISSLTMTMLDGTVIRYYLNAGVLCRDVTGGVSPVSFASVELDKFKASVSSDGRWLTLNVKSKYGVELSTTISLSRIPTA